MATVTINTVEYEGFSTVAAADTFLAADVVRALPWAALSADQKGRALISATRLMLQLPWCATAPDPLIVQAEPIPSVNAMLAADIAAKPKLFTDASGDSNIKSVKAGSAEVEFFSPVDGGPPLPLALWNILLNADLVCLNGISDINVTLDGAQPFGTLDGSRAIGGRYPWDWPIASSDYG